MLTALALAAAIQSGPDGSQMSEAELKHYFWICENTSSKHALDDSDGAACYVVYDQLKDRVFKGDNNALLAWWRSEKEKSR